MAVVVVEDMYTGLFFPGNGVCDVLCPANPEDTKLMGLLNSDIRAPDFTLSNATCRPFALK